MSSESKKILCDLWTLGHGHSRFNVCPVCYQALVRAVAKMTPFCIATCNCDTGSAASWNKIFPYPALKLPFQAFLQRRILARNIMPHNGAEWEYAGKDTHYDNLILDPYQQVSIRCPTSHPGPCGIGPQSSRLAPWMYTNNKEKHDSRRTWKYTGIDFQVFLGL
jgi:hypothetical protein